MTYLLETFKINSNICQKKIIKSNIINGFWQLLSAKNYLLEQSMINFFTYKAIKKIIYYM